MTKTSTATRDRFTTALVANHAEAHELLQKLSEKIDSIDPDTADWGHVGDLGYVIEKLRDMVGE